MVNQELLKLIPHIEIIIRAAGAQALALRNAGLSEHVKENGSIATNADIACENYLIESLGKLLPKAGFYAEESAASLPTTEYCWVIDPIDGTTNFVRTVPFFCISIALAHKNKPILGMIYAPAQDELFHGIIGGGAFLNHTKITVSTTSTLEQAVICGNVGYRKKLKKDAIEFPLQKIIEIALAYRTLGSAALELAYVAAGRIDAAIFLDLAWWDVAAATVLIQEAGGSVLKLKSTHPEIHNIFATNKDILIIS